MKLSMFDVLQCKLCCGAAVFVHICAIAKFTDTLIVIYEGGTISGPQLMRLPYCGCQLNGDGWGHEQHCNPESWAKQSNDF